MLNCGQFTKRLGLRFVRKVSFLHRTMNRTASQRRHTVQRIARLWLKVRYSSNLCERLRTSALTTEPISCHAVGLAHAQWFYCFLRILSFAGTEFRFFQIRLFSYMRLLVTAHDGDMVKVCSHMTCACETKWWRLVRMKCQKRTLSQTTWLAWPLNFPRIVVLLIISFMDHESEEGFSPVYIVFVIWQQF